MQQSFLIESAEAYHETMVIIYNLMNKGEVNLTSEELDNLEIMAIAAEQYKDEILGLKPSQIFK